MTLYTRALSNVVSTTCAPKLTCILFRSHICSKIVTFYYDLQTMITFTLSITRTFEFSFTVFIVQFCTAGAYTARLAGSYEYHYKPVP